MYLDSTYFILVLPAVLLSLWAQSRVNGTYQKYRRVQTRSGMTGSEIARRILDSHGLQGVYIEPIAGTLTDHYDPSAQVVRLSRDVFYGRDVAALGIAAHETGHAVQHAEGYFPLRIRTAIIPMTNFGSKLSIPLLFLGLLLGLPGLVSMGIVLYSLVTVFQLVTLPVEFNASSRAVGTLEDVLSDDELRGTKRVLSAAALTYVAALIVSAMQLLRLVLLYGNRRRR